ncbi:Medium-chain fatty-acid--CoA ligase [compost metagenome]
MAQVAIVAYPDERLGERACAFVVPRAGHDFDHAAMVDWLKAQKMALQYIPEKLVVRDALPATPAGKIQKFRLRDLLRDAV